MSRCIDFSSLTFVSTRELIVTSLLPNHHLTPLIHPLQYPAFFSSDFAYLVLGPDSRVRVTALMGQRLPSLVAEAALLASHFRTPLISR